MPKSTVTVPVSKLNHLADALEQLTSAFRHIVDDEQTPKLSVLTLKRPERVPKDQEWFWSKAWQKGEREVNEALRKGEYEVFDSAEELIKDLHSHA